MSRSTPTYWSHHPHRYWPVATEGALCTASLFCAIVTFFGMPTHLPPEIAQSPLALAADEGYGIPLVFAVLALMFAARAWTLYKHLSKRRVKA